MRKLFKRAVLGLFVLLLLLAVAAIFFPQLFLCVDSGPVNAEAIVLLGGGSHERYERAARLFKDHAAPRIIVSGYGDCEINRYLLINAGVPAKAIALENQSRTTRENAQFTIKLLREQKVKRVILEPRGIIRAGRWRVSGIMRRRSNFIRVRPILPRPAPIGCIPAPAAASVWNTRNWPATGFAMEFVRFESRHCPLAAAPCKNCGAM